MIGTFKQLVKLISVIATQEDYDEACFSIDRSFEHEKISWSDHEVLYDIMKLIKVKEG